jgi:hypothetical protein
MKPTYKNKTVHLSLLAKISNSLSRGLKLSISSLIYVCALNAKRSCASCKIFSTTNLIGGASFIDGFDEAPKSVMEAGAEFATAKDSTASKWIWRERHSSVRVSIRTSRRIMRRR